MTKVGQAALEYFPDACLMAKGGSAALGLNNNSSDIDYYVITNQVHKKEDTHVKCKVEETFIDFMGIGIETIKDKIREHIDHKCIYPTCFYRDSHIESQIRTLKDFDRPDFPREVAIRVFLSNEIIEFHEGDIQNIYNELRNGLSKIDIWDYHFTRANGNYHNFIEKQNFVLVRKYLYTIQELCVCDWIINRKEKPPMDFQRLLHEQCRKGIILKVSKLQKLNESSTQKKEKLFIKYDDELNVYIQEHLNATLKEMKSSEEKLRKYFLEI